MQTEPSHLSRESTELTPATWGVPRRVAFYTLVVMLLSGLNIAFWRVHLFPFLAWLPDHMLNSFYGSSHEFDGPFAPHKIHFLAIAANHWALMIGLILQFRKPINKVAPMLQAVGVIVVSAMTWPFNDLSRVPPPVFAVLPIAVAAGFLHPARIFSRRPRIGNRTMATVWGLAVIPFLFMLVGQMRLQMTGVPADPHWQGLHYNFMAEYALVALLILGLGASSFVGWRYSVWTGGFVLVVLGAGFLLFPNQASSQGVFWGLIMIGLATVWIILGEKRHRTEGTLHAGSVSSQDARDVAP